ncbi:emerin (Emery-Dreifuss muscular dystrophy) isoform 2-T2 [Anableps anableps]
MSLSDKSNAEISDLLTDYGIKHGPVVNSTRSLYERKLEEAMANDRTFYREEEEEIIYITYHHPIRRKTSANLINQRGRAESHKVKQPDQVREIPSSRIQRSSAEQHEDQPPDQVEQILLSKINQTSSIEPQQPDQEPNKQQPDQITEMGQERNAELHQEKKQNKVHLASVKVRHRTANHNHDGVEIRKPVRWRSEGKIWMVILALLLLTALTAGCYYTLSTVM